MAAVHDADTSVQKLFDGAVNGLLAERSAAARFAIRQARGNPARGRKLLAEIQARKGESEKTVG